MREIIFPEDVVNVIQSFIMVNRGDEATENIINSIGAEMLDISEEQMNDLINNWEN